MKTLNLVRIRVTVGPGDTMQFHIQFSMVQDFRSTPPPDGGTIAA
ncbi:hypothetical protein [Streptomyces virginiae]|nr:hypothetical protein [Streptomyces virginiae]MCX4957060.1 hypothetical protein [Streptomyces virginiae]MCX5175806.1 hypothetical protein [Streptomyces virginiae]